MDFWESLYLNEAFPESNVFNRYLMGMWEHNEPRMLISLYGACLMIRDEVLKKIGFFDGRFFMYYDEVDLCYRIKKAGGRIYYLPSVKVIHHSNKSSKPGVFEMRMLQSQKPPGCFLRNITESWR